MACYPSLMDRRMRALCLGAALLLLCENQSALAQSEWFESGRLSVAEIRGLCERVSDVRRLALMQMISNGNARWRQLSRQELVIETTAMGVPPLNPDRCYVIAHAGPRNEGERRAFEVRDFAVNPDRTSVFIIGHAYDAPPGLGASRVPCEPIRC